MFYFLKSNFFGRTYYAFKAHHGIEAKMVIFIAGIQKNITRPIKKAEIEAIHQGLEAGQSFLAIAEKYQVKEEDVLYLKSHPDCDVPYKNLQELKQSIAPYSFIVKKKDCYDLPDKTYKKVIVDLTDEQKRLYEELKSEYITMFYDSEVTVHQKIALYTRLSQIVGGFLPYTDEVSGAQEIMPTDKVNPKVDAVIKELEEASFPVLITTRFRAEARYLKDRLIKAYPTLNVDLVIGGISNKDAILDRYKNGKLDILVANEKIIAKGHNLQMGDTIITYSQGYSTETREQREDRIHRDGQLSKKCLYIDIIGRDTIDMEVYAVVRAGRKLLEYMTTKGVGEFLTTHSDEFIKEFQEDSDE
jgi:SNF2 family DNA or RNA helicase